MNEYTAIFDWDMTSEEAEVYKIAVLYEKTFKKVYGDEADGATRRKNSLPMRGDPRKSSLFRNCWRMRRETKGLLEPSEYQTYVTGNVTVMKVMNGRITPSVICGDKAWLRYKIWKRKMDAKKDEVAAEHEPSAAVNPKLIQQIDRTKKFLFEKCGGDPSIEKMKVFVESGMFKFWVASGKVSTIYVVLSPYVSRLCDLDGLAKDCSFSRAVFEELCVGPIRRYFSEEFSHEFR